MAEKLIKFFIWLAGAQLALAVFIFLASRNDPVSHAIIGMGIGLYIFWIILLGLLMKKFRDPIKNFVEKIKLDWRLKFIAFATILALVEEAITTAMTNTAPLYGVTMAAAHVTASANYWDVVLTNSVVLLVPMFFAWAWLLSKYDFSPNQVFLLYGFSGWFIEIVHAGITNAGEIGMWMLVYGLIIYLPAYSMPAAPDRGALKKPSPWLYVPIIIGVVIVGVIFGGAIASIIRHFRPPHYFPGIS
jgi:hypothetical protein